MNCVSCDICVYHLGLLVFFSKLFLISRVTGACPVTTDLIMRVNVTTTTTTLNEDTHPVIRAIREYHTQVANMSLDEILFSISQLERVY